MPTLPWARSYDAAVASARAGKKLILIDFYTDWCTYCKKLDAEVYTDPKVIQYCSRFVAVKVNAEKEGRELAKKYRVSGFPTILYLDAEGNEWGRVPGFLPSGPFIKFAQITVQTAQEQPALEAKLRQNPGNIALAIDLTERFSQQGNLKKALWAANLVTKAPQTPAMGRAYVTLGGAYFNNQNAMIAEPWFARAAKVSTDPRDKGYAQLGLALCASARQDRKGARAAINALLKIPNCPQAIQDKGREFLNQLPP